MPLQSAPSGPVPEAVEELRRAVDDLCRQLCAAVDASFALRVSTASDDHLAQRLAMLANFAITSAEAAVEEARDKERELREAHRIARIGTWSQDLATGRLQWSEEMHALMGTDPGGAEPTVEAVVAQLHPEYRDAVVTKLDALGREAASGAEAATEFEVLVCRSDGSLVWLWKRVETQRDEDGRVVALRGVAQDITERKAAAARIHHLAHYDPLTGVANRTLLSEHLERSVAGSRRGDGALAVLCLDLDGLKDVNDRLGHPGGDELLRQVAQRLREHVREGDLVGRFGGDEFAVVQAGVAQPADAQALADRLVAAVRAPFTVHGHRVEIGTSIGVALASGPEATPTDLLHDADVALHQAKLAGRGTWRLFEPGMDAALRRRRLLEAELHGALANGQFQLFYQPLVQADTQELTGFEALLRWFHPQQGMISPAEFIPLAEATGLIRPIGAWVLRRACADAAGWPEPLKVAVNLSPVQFAGETLVREVEDALVASGLAARRLELEITESVLLQDNAATLDLLHQLRALGASISMDDFGTGYSSLSYLRSFPFDKIKVDQSFVRSLERDGGSLEIVRAVVGLGRALGMAVLAEGVETPEQMALLRGEGCNELQGYLFSRPMPLRDVMAALAAHAAAGDASPRGPGRQGTGAAGKQVAT